MIEAALTAEEWRKLENGSAAIGVGNALYVGPADAPSYVPDDERRGVGALALLGYFTRKDLELLEYCQASVGWKREEDVGELSGRIQALLPPA